MPYLFQHWQAETCAGYGRGVGRRYIPWTESRGMLMYNNNNTSIYIAPNQSSLLSGAGQPIPQRTSGHHAQPCVRTAHRKHDSCVWQLYCIVVDVMFVSHTHFVNGHRDGASTF